MCQSIGYNVCTVYTMHANKIDIFIIINFGMTYYVNMSVIYILVQAVYHFHVTQLCAHSMGPLLSLRRLFWFLGVKVPWIHVPEVGLPQDISANHQYYITLLKRIKTSRLNKTWINSASSLKSKYFKFQSQIHLSFLISIPISYPLSF